jgi:hypothetical protein
MADILPEGDSAPAVIVTLVPVVALLAGAQMETPGDAGRHPPPPDVTVTVAVAVTFAPLAGVPVAV